MKGFFIKKAFFDGWDNLLVMVAQNLIYMAIIICAIYTTGLLGEFTFLGISILVLLLFAESVIAGGTNHVVYNWAHYKKEGFSAFKTGIKRNFRHAVLFFFLQLLLILYVTIIIPFYSMVEGNAVTFVITVALLWILFIFSLAFPFYFALSEHLPADRPFKTLKKCFIIMIDNIGFAVFYLFYSIICLLISIFTLGLVPGFVGKQLASQDAVKLLMYKYDFLEEHPDERKNINWDDLLFEEKKNLGPRSLKNTIFPWKD
ncbi:MAG TPA: hypothetical protein IAB12_00810 [Candidatus Ornithospirochaeta avicola]|uniref:Uncharacterized protein n=1 Tax=Candidatus Ornithospirochaeta avicola TaxID=2840896 RepID=A0A9D1PSA8_9SPIO|nr:hypothetical protein [Candidatus Ornithospirochaeta avicola]